MVIRMTLLMINDTSEQCLVRFFSKNIGVIVQILTDEPSLPTCAFFCGNDREPIIKQSFEETHDKADRVHLQR
jgi:hypothetical protein